MSASRPDASVVRYEHWINGEPAAPAGGAYLDSMGPLDDRLVARIARGGEEDVKRAVSAASAAQPAWAAQPPKERYRVLMAIASAIRAEAKLLVDLEIAETGK